MSRASSTITFTIMALISIVLPIAWVLAFYPELFQSTDPEKLGCEGPLAGLGLLSGLLMAVQMRCYLTIGDLGLNALVISKLKSKVLILQENYIRSLKA